MSRTKLIKRVKELRKSGLSFRQIEAKLTRTLGLHEPSNGTKAFRLLKAA